MTILVAIRKKELRKKHARRLIDKLLREGRTIRLATVGTTRWDGR